LADHRLARVEPFSLRARDGLTLHGYLTFPPGVPRRALPTVLTVHGGPWQRDVWGFNAEAQWLANRGYLCLRVNYRGSTGYGRDFRNAGDREWGGRMQTDLLDAVDFVVSRGYADPSRVAIYGGSYGGYAALAGVAFTPGTFRCAVALAAPADLRTFIGAVPGTSQAVLRNFRRRIGDPVTDADVLWSRSPLSKVDDIRAPVLIAHGANDPRVRRAESDRIVAALRARGIPHEYLLFDDEGHGLVRQRNRQAFYAAAERFLAAHLGGRREREPAAVAADELVS
jgi:dipeptidyl aminopeptidase/acylaminoacyl peptidase